ncbi:MAG: type II secretion system protein [Planctomycetota bacterium]|jgi:prepilin-type N-terminal cleavage/methylation domain-containing protein
MSRKQSAFTIIELLVVISIVVFLLATMYPFMVRSDSRSRDISCRKSHKELYASCHDYASDRGYFPKSEKGIWQHELALFYGEKYQTAAPKYYCPERASLGISKGSSDYGLNLFVGIGESVKHKRSGIGWLKISEFDLPDGTYFFTDTVNFSNPEFPNGSTGIGHADPVRYRPDRRHIELTRYNMTYVDGHFESMPYYSESLRFPEWIGTLPVRLK